MADEQNIKATPPDYTQLTQVRVPLEEAADAFAVRDASGRIPIVVVPQRVYRIRSELIVLAVIILAAGFVGGAIWNNAALLWPLTVAVAVLDDRDSAEHDEEPAPEEQRAIVARPEGGDLVDER